MKLPCSPGIRRPQATPLAPHPKNFSVIRCAFWLWMLATPALRAQRGVIDGLVTDSALVPMRGVMLRLSGATLSRGCPMQFFVDGVAIPFPKPDELPGPKSLAGIEVYQNTAAIPERYKTSSGASCGVILIWTKSG